MRFVIPVALAGILVACAPNDPAPSVTPLAATPTQPAIQAATLEERLQEALQLPEPEARKYEVLMAVDAFLRDPGIQAMSDQDASRVLTEVAFASESLTLTDPALIQRRNTRAIVGLPEGLGLAFYDLSRPEGSQPLEISPWSVGLEALGVTWTDQEAGVFYETISTDGVRRAHFALVGRRSDEWAVLWLADEMPDWWFNAQNATLSIAPDLSELLVIGEAESTTLAFDEADGRPRRQFRVRWVREGESYDPTPQNEDFGVRQDFIWIAAEPSPYATLVEFIERLQLQELAGAQRLVSSPDLMDTATSFGLYLIQRPYEVILVEADRIVFRGRQGTFAATFRAPGVEGDPWLITSIVPTGLEE